MSLRIEMLQVARLAPRILGDSVELVRAFLIGQQNEDGGFKNRVGKSDLYYTVFGLESLLAAESRPIPQLRDDSRLASAAEYLSGLSSGESLQQLDLVHLCCLARIAAALAQALRKPLLTASSKQQIASLLERFRSADGSYAVSPNKRTGTAYGAFLACGAYQDIEAQMPEAKLLLTSLENLKSGDGAWGNEPGMPRGSTNATAAAVAILRQHRQPIPELVGDWLLERAHPQGGFCAAPGAPLPDLLSTATSLHALAGMERSISAVKEDCLDFIDSLWTNAGGFYGYWSDDAVDVEYTFYGLLALGHLAVGNEGK